MATNLTTYSRRRHAMVAAGTWKFRHDVGPVRAHLERLRKAHMTAEQIAAEARLPIGTIYHVRNTPDLRYVTADTAERILAVRPSGTTPGVKFLPALGYRRRLLALFADGHSLGPIRDEVGISTHSFWMLYSGRRDQVKATTAARIRALYDRLAGTYGDDDEARAVAARNGGHPAMEWDDDTIDDPQGRPRRGSNRHVAVDFDEAAVVRALTGDTPADLTTADRREVIRRAWLAGEDDHLIADRLGMTVDAVRRRRHAHGYNRAAELAEAS